MNKKLIFNMKMYMDIIDVKNYLTEYKEFPDNVILCPEIIYIPYFINKYSKVALQNISSFDVGAYTGEVSALHAKKMGIKYTVIGHSERRTYFKETDDEINAKVKCALLNDLKVILCIGETLDDYESNSTKDKLLNQINNDLFELKNISSDNLIIAYEPVWAIGTGKTPKDSEIEETIKYIKDIIKEKYGVDISVVYGGSVNGSNISLLNKIENVDGFMIGGSSTKISEVNKIIEVVNG